MRPHAGAPGERKRLALLPSLCNPVRAPGVLDRQRPGGLRSRPGGGFVRSLRSPVRHSSFILPLPLSPIAPSASCFRLDSRTGTFRTLELTRTHAIMQLFVNHPQFPQHRLNCLSILGTSISIPRRGDFHRPTPSTPRRQLEGKSRCLYRLTCLPCAILRHCGSGLVAPLVAIALHRSVGRHRRPAGFGLCSAALLVVSGFYLMPMTNLVAKTATSIISSTSRPPNPFDLPASNQLISTSFSSTFSDRTNVLEALRRLSIAQSEAIDESEPASGTFDWLGPRPWFGASAFVMAHRKRRGHALSSPTGGVPMGEFAAGPTSDDHGPWRWARNRWTAPGWKPFSISSICPSRRRCAAP